MWLYFWPHFEWNLAEFWLHFGWILTEFWLNFGCILTEFWLNFDCILTETWLNFDWILTKNGSMYVIKVACNVWQILTDIEHLKEIINDKRNLRICLLSNNSCRQLCNTCLCLMALCNQRTWSTWGDNGLLLPLKLHLRSCNRNNRNFLVKKSVKIKEIMQLLRQKLKSISKYSKNGSNV